MAVAGHHAAGLLLLLLVLTGQCEVVYSWAGEGSAASDKAWEELLKQAVPVSTATVEVIKAAQYAVSRIHETYSTVLSSAHYASKLEPSPYFALKAILNASSRNGGNKYLLELLLENPIMGQDLDLASRVQASSDLKELFRQWRSERSQEMARRASQGKSVEEYRKALMQPVSVEEQASSRLLRAFFMGIDPIKDAAQEDVPAHRPEVHRVIVQIDADGEFDVQYHQRVGFLGAEEEPAAETVHEEL